MARVTRFLVVCVATMIAACGGGGGGSGGGGLQAAMQGTWIVCDGGGGGSFLSTFTISGSHFTQDILSYANDTCAGAGLHVATDTGSFAIGAAVTATVGGASVTAYQVTVTTDAQGTIYDLAYVDTAATPDRLYFGDSSGANDGSTPALRPTALDELYVLTKQ